MRIFRTNNLYSRKVFAGDGGRLPWHIGRNFESEMVIEKYKSLLNFEEHVKNIYIVCENRLILGCLVQCLKSITVSINVIGYNSSSQLDFQVGDDVPLVMLCSLGSEATLRIVEEDLPRVLDSAPSAKVVIISDVESPPQVSRSLELGAKGFIGMSSTFEIMLAAIRLVWAGGIFIPASSIGGANMVSTAPHDAKLQLSGLTLRQIEIVKCLRKGERNIDIARKFDLKESTVSVHIRNIMERLEIKSRNELIYLASDRFGG